MDIKAIKFYKDGAYYNFKKCEKIEDGIYLIQASGHTMGNHRLQ